MKALVFHGIGDIRLDDVDDPEIGDETDVMLQITASAICGTDLHLVRGTLGDMEPGIILGHEGVGVIAEVGRNVRNLRVGDRVVIPSSIACGSCSYCRAGYQAQCDVANPNGPQLGTAFFGGPRSSGPFNGLQAEFARIPFANVGPVLLPDEISDEQAILLSDIFPTGYFGAELAEVKPGNTVAVFGCGPVGQFAIASARMLGASCIIAVDREATRLAMAQAQGAEVINFEQDDPVDAIRSLTGGIGTDRAIDAVGIDAVTPGQERPRLFQPGDGPGQALRWCVDAVAKAGTLGIIGVYSEQSEEFPIGKAMERNLTVKMGNCHHRRYRPMLVDIVQSGRFDPQSILTQREPLTDAVEAYKAFDLRQPGWIKVELVPSSTRREAQRLTADARALSPG
jgi:threonine dehydrogenase-like Zn-dependent dehydrogenase